jgi:L-ascorbate metabolism protein UlaG (beta-lactamase superfamily)
MKLTLLRNATLVLEHGADRILVDPMLGGARSLPPFSFLRHRPMKNPTVPLPPNASELLAGITSGVVSHFRRGHLDHLDRPGVDYLRARDIEVFCGEEDSTVLRRKGIRATVVGAVARRWSGGTIRRVAARHGHGWIGHAMGCGGGYVLCFSEGPRVYLTGDTVMTPEVRATLSNESADVVVVHAGGASLDIGAPILMTLDEVSELVELATGRVVAVHLEALNHCPVTRAQLATHLDARGLRSRVDIPSDGETLDFGDLVPRKRSGVNIRVPACD